MNSENKQFNIGKRIQELRTERNLSQEQLALRSDITPTYLGLIERNQKNPTVKVVEQLCNVMDISLADFFSKSHKTTSKLDSYSLQILSQINNCSAEEKEVIVKIIKNILHLKNLGK